MAPSITSWSINERYPASFKTATYSQVGYIRDHYVTDACRVRVLFRLAVVSHRRAKGFQLAPEFGWTTTENTQVTMNKPGYGEVTFSTSQDGFRRYGDINATRPKILVIGDSYTYADTVSDGEAYFDRLGEKLDVEVFAFGCNGFGTLQELLILKKHFHQISPDLVVWQLCDNDFVNNSYELESRDLLQSNFMVRPYRVGERVEMRFPSLSGGWILRRSYLARWVFRRFFARGRQQFDYGNEQNKELANQAFELTAGSA